jgi:carbonic anhydrase
MKVDRDRLAGSQNPHTIVLSCSDSRVPPELVFDQALGEIFVIRVAGEALDSSVIGSIEYAVAHLGAKNIVVMGHTSCGAVKATLSAKPGVSIGSPSLDKLVADLKPNLEGRALKDGDLSEDVNINTKAVAANLIKRSEIIRTAVEKGELKVNSALYTLKTGVVDFL